MKNGNINRYVFHQWISVSVLLVILFLLRIPLINAGENTVNNRNRLYVFVIAASYEDGTDKNVAPLPDALNDAQNLLWTLRQWTTEECVIRSLLEKSSREPTGKNIEQELTKRLSECRKTDTVIIFFRGYRYKNVIFVPDKEKNSITTISVSWLQQQLANSSVRSKLLILDCDFVSEINIDLEKQVDSDISSITQTNDEVITIQTYPSGDENVQKLDNHFSLLSYWFSEALRGHADLNSDSFITIGELVQYIKNIQQKISKFADCIIPPKTDTETILTKIPEPKTLSKFFDQVAVHLTRTLQQKQIHHLGIADFQCASQDGNAMFGRSEAGIFTERCADKLELSLAEKLYQPDIITNIADRKKTRLMLQKNFISPEDLFFGRKLNLSATESIQAIVTGKVAETSRNGVCSITCELLQLSDGNKIAQYSAFVQLSETEKAEQGRSQFPTRSAKYSVTTRSSIQKKHAESVYLPEDSETTSISNEITFPVTFEVKRNNLFVPVESYRNDGRIYVPLQKEDIYRIRIKNPLSETVMVRLLVDGLNTLPEQIVPPPNTSGDITQYADYLKQTGAIVVQNAKRLFYQVAAPRGLDNARSWILRPNQDAVVEGFYHEVGQSGYFKEFSVTDASLSLGTQTNFTDQLGIVSIGFFRTVPAPKEETVQNNVQARSAFGTKMGEQQYRHIRVDASIVPDKLIESHQYYYGTTSLDTIKVPQTSKALLVGISDYKNLTPVRFAVNDVNVINNRLIATGFNPKNVTVLSGYERSAMKPERENIMQQIKEIAENAGSNDQIFVAFSGHGVCIDGISYLAPYGAEIPENINDQKNLATLIPLDWVCDQLESSAAQSKILYLDASQEQIIKSNTRSAFQNFAPIEIKKERFAIKENKQGKGGSLLLLTSCGRGEYSHEVTELNHSVYTNFLIEGLKGHADLNHDSIISFRELGLYASDKTEQYVRKHFKSVQNPQLFGYGDVPLIKK
jgi:hypothetical protein